MPTEMELTLEQTQQGVSYEVSAGHPGQLSYAVKETLSVVDIDSKSWPVTYAQTLPATQKHRVNSFTIEDGNRLSPASNKLLVVIERRYSYENPNSSNVSNE
ncbi:hypothetical protein Tco_0227926 [Tanacetum coccineum]